MSFLLGTRRNHGSHFEKAKTAIEEGGGRDELAVVGAADGDGDADTDSNEIRERDSLRVEDEKRSTDEKAPVEV